MRVPLRWLRDYVDYPWDADELAHRLTMSGLKVEAVERPGDAWSDIRIGEVLDVSPHPRSNKPLWVTHVHYGDGVTEIVTGAPNVFASAKVPVVLVGGSVPFGPGGVPLLIEPRPMAGIVSNGMLCSPGELGLEGDDSGIMILPDEAPLGGALADYLGEEVLDIETVSNRPDTLSMVGVAREVAALVPTELRLPDTTWPSTVQVTDAPSINIDIEDPALCPRYSALRIDGLTVMRSPAWLARRVEAGGLRPINLLVDLTNYVMLELGQPMHAFDASRLSGQRIVVRQARSGETIRTLDGTDRSLPEGALVIADGSRAVAVAGVMGGEESEITADTTSLILESANFNAPSVRRTAQALGMRTDASSRFEKGLPAETTVLATERFVHLLAEITEDPVTVYRVSDSWPSKAEPRTVAMPMRDLRRLLGIDVPPETASEILQRLGFDVSWEGDTLLAVVPSWRRVDIQSSADLVEEVGRIVGFDAIPSTLPFRTLEPPVPSPGWAWEQRVRDRLRALGVNETVTHSITSPALVAGATLAGEPPAQDDWSCMVAAPNAAVEQGATIQPVKLINPATVDRQVMRLTLVPSLVDVAAHNIKHTDERLAFFEVARTYFPLKNSPLAYEPRTLGIVLSGRRTPRSWQDASPPGYSFFDLKGMIECVLDDMHIRDWSPVPAEHPMLHPGRAAAVTVGGQRAGYFGELHPLVAERFDLATWPVQVAELNLDVLVALAHDAPIFEPLPRYPAAFRDIAVLLDSEVAADRVLALVREAGAPLLAGARVFDVYRGANIPGGKQSMAIEMSFQSPERTLTQAEVDDVVARIVATLHAEVGATLRD